MVEECKCTMVKEIERMQKDILKGEDNTKEIIKIVSDLKEGNTESKYVMMGLVASEKENKATNAANFKYIEDKRLADNLRIEKQKEDEAKAQDLKDAELLKEKRATKRAMWLGVFILAINTIVGLLVKYAPKMIGL